MTFAGAWALIKTFWKPLAGVLVVLALYLAASAWLHARDLHQQDIGANRVQAQWDAEKLEATTTALRQSQTNAAETARRLNAQAESQKENDHDQSTIHADRGTAGAAADGLRGAAAATVAAARIGCAAINPLPRVVGPAAGDPIGVLADVLARADARAGILADYADRARAAGAQCERNYDALTTPAGP